MINALAATINVSPNIPAMSNTTTVGPAGWIAGFYNFALLIAGVLAFGAIVYGGFLYATSAGNASRQSDGRSWIWSSLLGILLLGGAWLILHTINPNLVNLQIATLAPLSAGSGAAGGAQGTNNGGASCGSPTPQDFGGGACPTGQTCIDTKFPTSPHWTCISN